ncbi:hypothetical protein RGQ13_13745 [Thalassotalea psychrophila]|uniref:Esterase n=1 Tax=Thalassotalea psychrophila TaxID=3065647 RepID=A0ABY9TTU5_9GAMM|nr:hypothetical protein RGQ13_13745 [Colwelliaceae bacterium SQ149]
MNSKYQFTLSNLNKARSLDNYKIINSSIKNGKCIVFFSGNGLYFPNTEEELNKTIDTDRYEWQKLYPKNYEKVIFIRDVYKQWYVEGINEEIDSIDKLKCFLDKEIEGFNTTFIGSSAGGYAAVLLGDICTVDLIISLSGQFDLTEEKKRSQANEILHHSPRLEYLQLANLTNKNIVYFYPRFSEYDKEQNLFAIKNKLITIIEINSSIHGVPFYPFALKKILGLDFVDFKKLSNKNHNMTLFSLKYCTCIDLLTWLKIQLSKTFSRFKYLITRKNK